jgi:hypothetical protein
MNDSSIKLGKKSYHQMKSVLPDGEIIKVTDLPNQFKSLAIKFCQRVGIEVSFFVLKYNQFCIFKFLMFFILYYMFLFQLASRMLVLFESFRYMEPQQISDE